MLIFWIFFICYLAAVSLAAAIASCLDKRRAVRGGWRVPERTLLLLGLCGGALTEWLVMRKICHKTTRKKFMVGLPAIALLHCLLIGCLLYYFHP